MLLSSLIALSSLWGLTLAAPAEKRNTVQFVGINESGAEFGAQNLPGRYGTDYIFPDTATIGTFISQGMNIFRINILMERIIPGGMRGSLDANYHNNLTSVVNYITGKGAYAIIAPHNFGRYYGNVITSTSDFQAFWATIAAAYKTNSHVIFDTNNEYHDMPGRLVAELNQAAINGIRGVGATSQYITVEGNAYTGAWTWTTQAGTDGLTNAQTMGSLTDPSDKILYQMHQYLDSDGSGTSSTCVSSTIGAERLARATNWLRSNGKKGLLGEYAGGVNTVCEEAVRGMLEHVAGNYDVWRGALWWAAGPWWGNYQFSIEPTHGPAYSTYDPMIRQYL